MAHRIKGVFFDFGDTLVDVGQVDRFSLFEAGGQLAYDYLLSLNKPVPSFGRYHRRQLWAVRWHYFKSRLTRREFNALDVIGKLAASMGHDLTFEQTVELACLWYEPLSQRMTVEDGLAEMLANLRNQGLTLGVISNTFVPSQALDRHLARLGLIELLSVRVYSCDVRFRKPDARIFSIALERADLAADETLFVGDSLEADIGGANSAGMVSVLKDPADRHRHCRIKPKHRIRKLAELSSIIAAYNGRSVDHEQAQGA